MKNFNKLKIAFLSIIAAALFSIPSFAQKAKPTKFLDNKKFNVQFYEVKPTGRGKAQPSLLFLKAGKIEADLMYEKLSLPPVAMRVILDSTYTEDEVLMHMVTFEADHAEDKNDYHWEVTLINYDIEGTVVQMKSGLEKKKYEFSGTEKTKK